MTNTTKVGDSVDRGGLTVLGPISVQKSDGTVVTVADTDGNVDAPVTTTNLTATGNTQLGNAGTDTLGINTASIQLDNDQPIADSSGNELIEFTKTASAVNHVGVVNSATGNNPRLRAEGEADTGITFDNSEGEEILVLNSIASSVNHLQINSAATGGNAQITVTGDDAADVGIEIFAKAGTSATDAGGQLIFTGGTGNTTGAGGAVSLTAGTGGNDAVGGVASLAGGAAGGGNRAGGAVSITGGVGSGTGAGGVTSMTSGAGAAGTSGSASGAVTIASGAPGTATTGTGGAGGTVSVTGAAGADASGAGGVGGAGASVNITAGAGGADTEGGSGTGGAGGNVVITAGAGGAGATPGSGGLITMASATQFSNNAAFNSIITFTSTETIAAGGTSTAIDLSKYHHYIDADAGGDTFTIAAGTPGQVLLLEMASATGTATITPASFAGGTSITFNAAGDTVELYYSGASSAWIVKGGNSYAVI